MHVLVLVYRQHRRKCTNHDTCAKEHTFIFVNFWLLYTPFFKKKKKKKKTKKNTTFYDKERHKVFC